jgi:sugar transferase (PEP-CTERM/EpsH1 system associated)
MLYISHRLPYPPDKGERIRAFHELQALARDFMITLACPVRSDDEAALADSLRPWCQEIITGRSGGPGRLLRAAAGLFWRRSVTEGFFYSRRLKRRLAEVFRRTRFDIVVGYSSAVLPYVLEAPAQARVMDLVDVDSLKWLSYARKARAPMAWLCRRESRLVADLERRAAGACDAVICVSSAEARVVPMQNERLFAVANGVDVDYFRPSWAASEAPPSLVFVGTMSYRPNADAVCWFCRNVWPELRRRIPRLTFKIVGRDPTRQVRKLGRLDGVAVTGSVPDVRPYLSSVRVAVAPLQMARGVQNKVLEAMAMARPVVGSSAAIEGLDVSACDGLLRADTPVQWLRVLTELLPDGQRCGRLGRRARSLVSERYNWSACMEPMRSLCSRLAGREGVAEMTSAGAACGVAAPGDLPRSLRGARTT